MFYSITTLKSGAYFQNNFSKWGGREQDGQTSLRNVFNGSKFLVSKEERLMEPS